MNRMLNLLALSICLMASVSVASAAVIVAPVSGVINAGGPGFGSLTNTFNQAGLSIGYVNGVTDFDAYMALNPMHTLVFACCEWFSNSGTTSATVTYDLGSVMSIDRLALWNEESSGIGLLNLYFSTDDVTYLPLALGLLPTDNPLADYPADVFAFAAQNARYVRFEMSGCPQPDPAAFPACAIGEVAFSSGVIPEPGTVSLLGLGLAGLLAWARRRR